MKKRTPSPKTSTPSKVRTARAGSSASIPPESKKIAALLKVLAHPLRLLIVCHLLSGEMFAQELLESLGTSKGNISQHLTALLNKKIIARRKDGRHNYYRIADENVHTLISTLKKLYCPNFVFPKPHP
jgi:DNA-binding transcriptional ArsR family regulator